MEGEGAVCGAVFFFLWEERREVPSFGWLRATDKDTSRSSINVEFHLSVNKPTVEERVPIAAYGQYDVKLY